MGDVRFNLKEGDPINVGDVLYGRKPLVYLTAKWERAYDIIHFNVYNELYCSVCIEADSNQVVYPEHDPVIVSESGKWEFYGWDCAEGDYLPGVDRSATIICGNGSEPLICQNPNQGGLVCDSSSDNIVCPSSGQTPYNWEIVCEEEREYIVCEEDDEYAPINAYVVETSARTFKVMFKYMGADG